MKKAIEIGTAFELHGYGRRLLTQQKIDEALQVFQTNYDRNKGAWPTNVAAITLGSGEEGIEEFEVSLAYQYWQSTGSGNPITDVTSGKEPVVVDDPGQRQRPGLNGD